MLASNPAPLSPFGLPTWNTVRRGLPSAVSRNSEAGASPHNQARLCLSGRFISWATTGNPVRFERVAALREAIRADAYSHSSRDLAERIMDEMQEA